MTAKATALAAGSQALAPLAAIAIALALLYVAGFADIEALHNGAHDARHSAGMPCH